MSNPLQLERSRKLADLRMVANNGKATRDELRWALRSAIAFAEQANSKLRLAEPILDAVTEIATDAAREWGQ